MRPGAFIVKTQANPQSGCTSSPISVRSRPPFLLCQSNSVPLAQSLVDTLARDAGFTLAGVAAIPAPGAPESREESRRFEDWIASGSAGEMDYLKRRNENGELARSSVRTAFPWARSVIVCVANYNADQPRSIDPAPPGSGWVARYAWSGIRPESGAEPSAPMRPTDYHKVLLKRLAALDAALHQSLGPFESRCYVDTGPLVERVYARYAGLGWTGKNTCILNQRLGSWFFLGVILTSLELPAAELPQLAADRCGSCTRCIDACPTQALTPVSDGRHPLHLLPDHREARRHPRRPPRRHRPPDLRLRHLPGCLPLES